MTKFGLTANGYDYIIILLTTSLNTVRGWTGSTEVAPGIFQFPTDLAQNLQTLKAIQDSRFNTSSDTYQQIVIRAGIVNNLNGTISGLQSRVRSVFELSLCEFEMLSLSQATYPLKQACFKCYYKGIEIT